MLECYFDGACEPKNPGGNMGYGACIVKDGEEIYCFSDFEVAKPENTNNVAEYKSFEHILDKLLSSELHEEEIVIMGDSKLVIEQMFGTWKIKNGAYVSFAISSKNKLKKFKNLSGRWVPREQNQRADDLSKEALIQHHIKIASR